MHIIIKNANFKSLTMNNNSNITLGNGSVGIYTRGQDNSIPSAVRNTVTMMEILQ